MKNFEPNVPLYEKMKVPYESSEDAAKKIKAFFEDLAKIREKHKIENMVCWINGKINIENAVEEFITGQTYGNIEKEPQIAQYAYKQAIKSEIIREIQ